MKLIYNRQQAEAFKAGKKKAHVIPAERFIGDVYDLVHMEAFDERARVCIGKGFTDTHHPFQMFSNQERDITLDEKILNEPEREQLATDLGYASVSLMLSDLAQKHPLPFNGVLIRW